MTDFDSKTSPVSALLRWSAARSRCIQVTCSSIGALHVDSFDGVIYMGCGVSTSSEQGPNWFVTNSPYWGGGVFFSSDGGRSWSQLPGFPEGYGVSDIVSFRSDSGRALLISSRGSFFTGDGGGIWASLNESSLKQVFFEPVFDLLAVNTGPHTTQPAVYAALPLTANSIFVSTDLFATWHQASASPLPWSFGNLPFYLAMDVTAGAQPLLVVLGLTVAASNVSATFSDMFYADLSTFSGNLDFKTVKNQPLSLDEDGMPKDRAAVMADPERADIVYVAGNAGAVAWRVDVTQGRWDIMYGNDTRDGSCPHCDCRSWAWDHHTGSALLTSDGGVFLRTSPRAGGGVWKGVQGDMTVMEFYTAAWDSRLSRWIAGAQDNCVQLSSPGAAADAVAECVVDGDGIDTQADNVNCPSRLWGSIQFAYGLSFVSGWGASKVQRFVPFASFFQSAWTTPFFFTKFVVNPLDPDTVFIAVNGSAPNISTGLWSFRVPYNITLPDYQPNVTNLIQKMSQYRVAKCVRRLIAAGFNESAANVLALSAESQRRSREHGTGIGEIIEDAIQESRGADGDADNGNDGDEKDLTCTNVDLPWSHVLPLLQQLSPGPWAPPILVYSLPSCVYVFSVGAFDKGISDPFAFAGINNSHIFIGRQLTPIVIKPLPFIFAQPVNFVDFDGENPILGPVSHGKTVSLAVAPWDAGLIAVTGWSTVDQNSVNEPVLLTRDAGDSWEVIIASSSCADIPSSLTVHQDITGNLQTAVYGSDVAVPLRPSRHAALEHLYATSNVESHSLTHRQPRLDRRHLAIWCFLFLRFRIATSSLTCAAGPSLIILGTATGVFASIADYGNTGRWFRVGLCSELPMVIASIFCPHVTVSLVGHWSSLELTRYKH